MKKLIFIILFSSKIVLGQSSYLPIYPHDAPDYDFINYDYFGDNYI